MKVSLRPFEENDLISLQVWVEEIESQRFMSRILPRRPVQNLHSQETLLAWYVIQKGDQSVGVVWLEKEAVDDETVTLGILIGNNDFLGQGIGEKAINLAIDKSRDELNFKSVRINVRESNTRAISCYRKCGFMKVFRGAKFVEGTTCIPFVTMELKHNQPSNRKP